MYKEKVGPINIVLLNCGWGIIPNKQTTLIPPTPGLWWFIFSKSGSALRTMTFLIYKNDLTTSRRRRGTKARCQGPELFWSSLDHLWSKHQPWRFNRLAHSYSHETAWQAICPNGSSVRYLEVAQMKFGFLALTGINQDKYDNSKKELWSFCFWPLTGRIWEPVLRVFTTFYKTSQIVIGSELWVQIWSYGIHNLNSDIITVIDMPMARLTEANKPVAEGFPLPLLIDLRSRLSVTTSPILGKRQSLIWYPISLRVPGFGIACCHYKTSINFSVHYMEDP